MIFWEKNQISQIKFKILINSEFDTNFLRIYDIFLRIIKILRHSENKNFREKMLILRESVL